MAITRAQRVQAQTHSNAARNALPDLEPGRFIWNGTSNKLEVYNGGTWQSFYIEGNPIDGGDISGTIDGSQISGQIDGALLYNEVDGALLVTEVDGALLDQRSRRHAADGHD